jgi:putative transposase
MAKRFKNKYLIPSYRLANWDYGTEAAYFITVSTKDRSPSFGHIKDGKMHLSALGKVVAAQWLKTPLMRPDMNLILGEFVVMPDHFHAILHIGKNNFNSSATAAQKEMHLAYFSYESEEEPQEEPSLTIQEIVGFSKSQTTDYQNKFGPQRKNLASIMRGFKSAITMEAYHLDPKFKWERRYHEAIIRDEIAHRKITYYIRNNPKNAKK